MNNRHLLVIAAVGMTCLWQGLAAAADSKGAKSYRWVDSNGVTHYGDRVPPEYSAQGRSELNRHGVPVREFPRQLTPAEAADAQKVAANAARLRQHDSFLLTTYTHVSDIEQLRDERLALIDGHMNIARGSLNSIDQRIGVLETRMRNFQPYSTATNARRMPDQVAEEVVRAMKERRSLQDGLNARENEKTELRAQFDADIARYRELTTRPATR